MIFTKQRNNIIILYKYCLNRKDPKGFPSETFRPK